MAVPGAAGATGCCRAACQRFLLMVETGSKTRREPAQGTTVLFSCILHHLVLLENVSLFKLFKVLLVTRGV